MPLHLSCWNCSFGWAVLPLHGLWRSVYVSSLTTHDPLPVGNRTTHRLFTFSRHHFSFVIAFGSETETLFSTYHKLLMAKMIFLNWQSNLGMLMAREGPTRKCHLCHKQAIVLLLHIPGYISNILNIFICVFSQNKTQK